MPAGHTCRMSTDRDTDTVRAHGDDCGCGRSRRDVLAMAGVGVLGAGLLAACGGSSDGAASAPTTAAAPTTAPTTAAPTTAAPTTAPPTTGAPTTTAPTTAAPTSAAPTAAGFTVQTTDIPVGSGKIYDQQKLVVTQPTAGQFKAFSAVCPHQGCNVAAIENEQIQCPCHASLFDITTGDRISGPAQTGLSTEKLTVSGTTVTVAI